MHQSRLLLNGILSIILIFSTVFLINVPVVSAKSMVSRSFYVMGTNLSIDLECDYIDYCYRVIQKAQNEVLRLDKTFSNYRNDSELYKVVNSDHASPVKVSKDFFELTAISQFINILSNGAFDITAGSIVDLWKSSSRSNKMPSPSAISKLTANCTGLQKLILISSDQSIKFNSDCIDIDFGAIGKGYALDKISELLNEEHITGGIINFGGNILAKGKNLDGNEWKIDIKVPPSLDKKIELESIYLSNMSVSTSGGYERYYEINGKKYSHIIDPRTGYPIDNKKSVSVVSTNATIADALSTAFSVMDIEEIKRFLSVLDNIGVLIISDDIIFENDYFKRFHRE